jgi:hypothetical protein
MANSTLTTVYSWSLNLNNMINLSLMKDDESKFNKYFIFFNAIPSVKNDDGQRSYSFRDGINFKLQPYKLYELSQVIPVYLKGGQKMLGNYGIINDSSKATHNSSGYGGIKSLYVNYSAPEERNKNVPGIFMVASQGDKKVNISIPAPTALALAKMCEKIFELCVDMDIKAYEPYTGGRASDSRGGYNSSRQNDAGGYSHASSQPQENSSDTFQSFDDDAPF